MQWNNDTLREKPASHANEVEQAYKNTDVTQGVVTKRVHICELALCSQDKWNEEQQIRRYHVLRRIFDFAS